MKKVLIMLSLVALMVVGCNKNAATTEATTDAAIATPAAVETTTPAAEATTDAAIATEAAVTTPASAN